MSAISLGKLKQKLTAFAAKQSPKFFRRAIRISDDADRSFESLMQPWQAADFKALDPAWMSLAGRRVRPDYLRAYIERPRGHAKTSDMAVQMAWILLFSPRPLVGLAAAADRDQAGLLHEAVQRIARLNPVLCADLKFQRHAIFNSKTYSRLDFISSDVESSWGALPDFVICDELCHWEKADMWFSLCSSAAKQPHCVLVVLTNAGVGRGWQWEVREEARTSPFWYFSSLEGSQAPWIEDRWLQEQERLLPRPIYERLWQNVWQHSDGEFVTLAEAEACRDPSVVQQEWGRPGIQYIAAIDYAEKHDFTVGVIVHEEPGRIVVDRMDVAVPRTGHPVKIAWVESWIERAAARFGTVTFVVDPYQLVGTIQRLESRYDICRFEFAGGRGNHALAMLLRKLIVHRELAWFPGCGAVPVPSGRDDLETELASLVLRQSGPGRCRIDHVRDRMHHDDRAFALGAACLHCAGSSGLGDWLAVTPPDEAGGFDWGGDLLERDGG